MVAAKKRKSRKATEREHRGRIQAQGGGVEVSVSWSRQTPPSESEMMEMIQRLEAKLTPAELRHRETGFEELRKFIQRAAAKGGTSIARPKSFPFQVVKGIRVDLEIMKGMAAVPEKTKE
jgi:hypothetical protein